ncbi:hypothetical protein BGLA2_1170015 [Burkholderia gladioli]|nr:hypothetical protein BGLA2_1170015 [Burkholderia gladioli]
MDGSSRLMRPFSHLMGPPSAGSLYPVRQNFSDYESVYRVILAYLCVILRDRDTAALAFSQTRSGCMSK